MTCDPLFPSVLIPPVLVHDQRAPHFGEQLKETLQEEADRKWEHWRECDKYLQDMNKNYLTIHLTRL